MLINVFFYDEICNLDFCSTQRILGSSFSTIARFLILILFIPIISNINFLKLLKYMKIGFIISSLYIVIEIFDRVTPYYFDFDGLGIIDIIQPYFHHRLDYDYNRTRGFAFEPSFQALYLITALPFLVVINSRILLVIWFLCFYSTLSLTAVLGFVIFIYFYYGFNNKRNNILLLLIVLSFFILVYFLFTYIDYPMTSSITRVGSWVAALKAIAHNPFFGVGASMSGYWVSQYYPDFFNLSFESGRWRDVGLIDFSAPTFASILTFILDFGIPLFIFIIFFLFKNDFLRDIKNSKLATAACYSLIAASFGINTYAFWGYWFFLTITLARKWPELDRIHLLNLRR